MSPLTGRVQNEGNVFSAGQYWERIEVDYWKAKRIDHLPFGCTRALDTFNSWGGKKKPNNRIWTSSVRGWVNNTMCEFP